MTADETTPQRRTPLNRDRIVVAAVEFADREGLDALSMRKLGRDLGVEAMSLYNHVANKDDLLDGMIDVIVELIGLPDPTADWRRAMRDRAISAREVLRRHPWATRVMETRTTPGIATLRYYDAVLGILRGAGFPLQLAMHAFSATDAYVYGFTMQEIDLPFDNAEELEAIAADLLAQLEGMDMPHLAEVTRFTIAEGHEGLTGFEFGLDLILDGFERARGSA